MTEMDKKILKPMTESGNCGYWCSEQGSNGTPWHEMC